MNISVSAAGVGVTLPDITLSLPGGISLGVDDLSAQYTASPQQSLTIQGSVWVTALFGVTASANFTGSNYIEITDHDIEVVGTASLTNDLTIGGWGLKQVTLSINTSAGSISGNATIVVPPGVEVDGGLGFLNGKLDSASIGVDDLSTHWGNGGVLSVATRDG